MVEQKQTSPELVRLSSISNDMLKDDRFLTGITGLDSCLSESDDSAQGLPYGTSVLISGMPGGGKSTIVTYIANSQTNRDSLYLHGEEKASRVKQRWNRLKLEGTDPYLAELRSGEDAARSILDASMERGLGVCILDSIQCLTWRGKRGYDDQFLAAEYLSKLVTANGGTMIMVSHVDKSGKAHKGAAELAHMVDIHLHLTTHAKKSERLLEVRKNRMGPAGYQVPVNISISGITIGTPAPLSSENAMAARRSALEKAAEAATALLLAGETLDGYSFDQAGVAGGSWRVGLEFAVKRLIKEGYEVLEQTIKGRKSFTVKSAPQKAGDSPPADKSSVEKTTVDALPIELD